MATTQAHPVPAKCEPLSTYDRKAEAPQGAQARTKKISFLADPRLEERFRKARLRAGFDKLEDAYNEAIKTFREAAPTGAAGLMDATAGGGGGGGGTGGGN